MTVKRSAALFPGQGAYAPGALAAVRDLPEVRETLCEIDAVTGRLAGGTVSDLLYDTDAPDIDELLRSSPDLLQAAIYGTSVAAYRVLLSRGPRPDVLVGHSFGEIAALVCADAFSVTAGAEIVCHRGAALDAAGERDGCQLALSTDVRAVEQILLLIGDPQAVVAAENHAAQTVIAGPGGSVEKAHAIATALRIGTAALKSAYPFHSPMLSAAALDFALRIRHIPQQRPRAEVCSPILGRAYRDTDDLTAALAGHLTRRVRFADTVRALRAGGVGTFVECGALDALTKITRGALGDGPEIVSLLRDSVRPEIFAEVAGQVPQREADEFDRLWQTRVERIAQLTISEFVAAMHDDAPARAVSAAVSDEPPAPALTPRRESVPEDETPSRKELFQQLVVLYANALEYPPEVFDEDTDLEAELGVDSVKQTELLMRIGDTYRLGPLPADFKIGELNTLGRIADLIVAT
ncbi:acyltransferase domain-containing protein [Nocardia sp. NPDC051570]|uniref:acyltransferase domain-containing protein n=1 Tax=Nocardia sp. NPDC051570 TaxID=3364324 RepID=UPI0037A59B77